MNRVNIFSGIAWMCVAGMGISTVAWAEGSRFYGLEGFGNFLDGNPESTAVAEDGTLLLPARVQERFADPTAAYGAAAFLRDRIVVSRVDDGRILAIAANGAETEVAKFEGRLVTAMVAIGRDLYVATGPEATVHRVRIGSEPKEFAKVEAAYIWGLTKGKDDALYAVTGTPGSVVKVTPGKVDVVFSPEQEHLRSIAYDSKLGLFVGGGQRGIVYRSADLKNFRALYDTNTPEVTSLVLSEGFVYAAGVSGAEALVQAQGEGETKGVDVSSQMVRIAMDGRAETLAGSNDEAIFAMAVDAQGHVLVATGATGRDDPRGRIYTVDPKAREIALTYQSTSRRITHLVSMEDGQIAAVAAAGGRIVEIDDSLAKTGEFFSAPFDAGINSKFGQVRVYGTWPNGTSVTSAVRTGQTASPDQTWSEWSNELPSISPLAAKVPNGRFMQVRLTLKGDGKITPTVHGLRVAYLRQNLPPFVREVVALEKGIALQQIRPTSSTSKTVNLENNGPNDAKKANKKKAARGRARQVKRRGALTVRWVAEDPNGDALEYALRYRALGNSEWTELDKKLEHPFYTMNSAQFPDGHYQFQVRATDAPSNPDGVFMEDTRESRAVLVDNTPPAVERADVRVNGTEATLRVAVADNVGPIVACDFAVDGRAFRPMPPDDGVLDGAGETFTLKLSELSEGAHSVTFRARDEAHNEGYGQTTFEVR